MKKIKKEEERKENEIESVYMLTWWLKSSVFGWILNWLNKGYSYVFENIYEVFYFVLISDEEVEVWREIQLKCTKNRFFERGVCSFMNDEHNS